MSVSPLPTALVVDADPEYQREVAKQLAGHYHVVSCGTLREGYDHLQEHPSIMILELDMPDGDGLTLLSQVRENPIYAAMSICCLTARRSIQDKVAAFQQGADDYVVKPLSASLFLLKVQLLERIAQLRQ